MVHGPFPMLTWILMFNYNGIIFWFKKKSDNKSFEKQS